MMDTTIQVRWISHNGMEWDLMSGADGVFLSSGLDSLMLPNYSLRMVKKARMPGARYNGVDWDYGTAQLGVTVADTRMSRPEGDFRRGVQWLELDSAFRDSFSMFHPGTLEVESHRGTRKFYGFLEEMEGDDNAIMPDIRGTKRYTINLAAELPFFEGTELIMDFPFVAGQGDLQYFSDDQLAPSFYIAQGASIGNSSVLNPSQVESWPKWILDGPGRFRVGVEEHITDVPHVAAGERLTIDTNPHTTVVLDSNGERAWNRIGQYDFAPIQPGEAGRISTQIVEGAEGANVRMVLPTWYLSAW